MCVILALLSRISTIYLRVVSVVSVVQVVLLLHLTKQKQTISHIKITKKGQKD